MHRESSNYTLGNAGNEEASYLQKKLESVLAVQAPATTDENGVVFDRDEYLKEEGFDDVEVPLETRGEFVLAVRLMDFPFPRLSCRGATR